MADSLDDSHQQKIRDFTFQRTDDAYNLWVSDESGDLSLERASLREKGDLFNDIFGAPIDLKQGILPPEKGSA